MGTQCNAVHRFCVYVESKTAVTLDDKHAVFPNAIFDVATLNTLRAAFDRTVVPPSTSLTGQSVSRRLQNDSVCLRLLTAFM